MFRAASAAGLPILGVGVSCVPWAGQVGLDGFAFGTKSPITCPA